METTLRRFHALIALAVLLAFTCPTMTLAQSTTPDHVALSWTNSPATTMTVTWRTNTSVKVGLVEYGKGSTLPDTAGSVAATSSEFTTDLGASRLFRATVTNLSPNTQYCYRVGDGEHWSTASVFSTADPKTDKVKFLIFGDSQSVPPYSTWQTTVHNAYKANQDAKFMVNVGDLVDVGQSGDHWNAWYSATAGVIDTIPEMPVIGNHETTGKHKQGERKPEYWLAQFTLPQNGPEGLKSQAYSYDYGPVHIAVLDSQGSEEKQYGDILTPQAKWLDADLAASKATWKLVFFHKAPYELHPTRQSTDVSKAFCPVMESNHADMVFSGHDHGIGRTYPIKSGEFKRKPSEGTVYWVVGRSGSKAYSVLMPKAWNAFFYNPVDQPNYLVVEVGGAKLTIRAMKQDGTLIDTFFIDKAKDVSSDCVAASK